MQRALALFVLIGAFGCGDGRKSVVVTPDVPLSARGELASFVVEAPLNGKDPQQGRLRIPAAEVPFTLQLPADAQGTLVIRALAQSAAAVDLALGEVEVKIDQQTEYQVPLPLHRYYAPSVKAGAVLSTATPRQALLVDLNGDGNDDLVVARASAPSLAVFMGKGDGGFPADPALYQVDGDIRDMATADLNGDGKPDLVLANGAVRQISVLINRGDGSLRLPAGTYMTQLAEAVAIGDVAGNGEPDVVVANVTQGGVQIFPGTGEGGFGMALNPLDRAIGYNGVAVADLDGDEREDLILARQDFLGNGGVQVALNKGGGAFQPPRRYGTGNDGPQSVALGDFNEDGHTDVVAASLGAQNLAVLLNGGDGTLLPAQVLPTGMSSFRVAVTDFNGDGHDDLVAPLFEPGGISLLIGKGNGRFFPALVYPTALSGPSSIAVGDVNGDGLPDLVVNHETAGKLSVFLNTSAHPVDHMLTR